MMTLRSFILCIVAAACIGFPALAQQQQPTERELVPVLKACLAAETTAHERDDACSKIIDSGLFSEDIQATAYAFRSTARLDVHDYAGGLRDITAALEISPNNYGYLDARARVFGMMGKYDLAIQDLDFAIQIAPEAVSLYVNRATAHAEMDNFDAAFRDLDTAARINPRHVDIFAIRGGIHVKRKQYPQAIAEFDRAIELEPQYSQLFLRRGYAKMFSTGLKEAFPDFDQAIQLGSDSPDVYLYRGMAYSAAKNPDDAFADFSAVIDRDPTIAVAWHRRGLIHMNWHNYDRARDDMDVAAQIAPSADYLNSIAWLLVAAEDHGFRDPMAALDYVEKSIAIEENADNVDTAAAVQTLLGNQDDAMRYYIRSMELGGEERIRMYQEYLADRGYYQGQPDGIDGPNTRAAIAAFSAEKRVLLVD